MGNPETLLQVRSLYENSSHTHLISWNVSKTLSCLNMNVDRIQAQTITEYHLTVFEFARLPALVVLSQMRNCARPVRYAAC